MTVNAVSNRRRRDVIGALRRGTVPESGLDLLAVGLDRFAVALDGELDAVADGGAVFKAVRGEYGAGKTFFTRHLAEKALRRGFAAAEVQISETETPLHRLETVYRRITESLRTASLPPSAFRGILDSWLFTFESDVLTADPSLEYAGAGPLAAAVDGLLERRLAEVTARTPVFSQALRGYRAAVVTGDGATADGLAAWMGGQPQIAASAKRAAGIRGDLDHFGAFGFLQGLLTVLRDAGHLRQLIDEIDAGRFPGLYLLVTGTPAFFDGPSGVPRLPPLAQRLATDFGTDARFDNPRAVQIRLPGFDHLSLLSLGVKVRDLYVGGSAVPDRVLARVDDAYLGDLATAVAGRLGGKVGIAPRIFLKKLVADVLDRVDLFEDFDPRGDYALTVDSAELTDVERVARGSGSLDDLALDVDASNDD